MVVDGRLSLGIGVDGDHSGGTYFGYGPDWGSDAPRMYYAQYYQARDSTPGVPNRWRGDRTFRLLFEGDHPAALHIYHASEPPYGDGAGTAFSDHPAITITEAHVTPFDRLHEDPS